MFTFETTVKPEWIDYNGHLQDVTASHRVLARPEAGTAGPIRAAAEDLTNRLRGTGGQA